MAFVFASSWTYNIHKFKKNPGHCTGIEVGQAVRVTVSSNEGAPDVVLSRNTVQNLSETSSRKTSIFREWASRKKIRYPHLEIHTFDTLRGMQATAPLVGNAPVMSVPSAIALETSTFDSVRSPMQADVCDESWKKLPWFVRLALKLHARKQTPEFRPWVRMLPRSFDTPLHWAEMDISELQNPQFALAIHRQRKTYRKIYDELCMDTRNKIGNSMTYSDFLWAVECVRSRSFSGPLEVAPFKSRFQLVLFAAFNTFTWPSLQLLDWDRAINGGLTAILALVMYDVLYPKILKTVQNIELRRYALAPGIDFLNHSSDLSSAANVAYEYFLDRFVVRARQDYQLGDQVQISYGAQSNDSLLQYYGFVDDCNPNDDYVLGGAAEKLLKVEPGKLRLFGNRRFSEATMKHIVGSLEGGAKEIGEILAELCRLELGRFETSLEEDEKLLQTCDLGSRRGTAIRYRIGKKRILKEAQRLYEQDLK